MFNPPATLAHRHLQSIFSQVPWRRRRIIKNAAALLDQARAELIDCGDGIRLQGFLSTPPGGGNRGLIVLLHGWEGSAESSYILSAGTALYEAGFSVFRLNFRDHGKTQALNEGLFHSCRIDEVMHAVMRIRETHPARHFGIVGQSLGGNFALRIAARAALEGLDIGRVLAVCPVLKPHSTMQALDQGFWLYRRYFLARWRRSLAAKAAAFPHLYQFGDLRRFNTLTTTRFFVENYTEFDSLDQYLEGYAVIGDVLASIGAPTRIVLAEDDPMIPVTDLNLIARSAALEVSLLPRGGHCGFVDRLNGPSWIDREILQDFDIAFSSGAVGTRMHSSVA